MKNTTLYFALLIATGIGWRSAEVRAQQLVIDPQHLLAVTQNGVVRSSAEAAHEQYLAKINTSLNELNTNAGSVVLAQTVIYEALSNVNSALKNGLEVKNMALIVNDILSYVNQTVALVRQNPMLLAAAGQLSQEMRSHAQLLVSDVSDFVLKEGNNVLADYNARDELLRKVTQQLQIIDGLAYGAWRAMYWAKERGLWATLNPFTAYLNQDKRYVAQIIQNAKYLKP